MTSSESPDEHRAAVIIERVTKCRTKRLDRGDGVQFADYGLFDSTTEQVGLLEVTSITCPEVNSFWSKRATKDRSWRDPSLRWDWRITVDSATWSLRRMRKPLRSALPQLEAKGTLWASAQPWIYKPPRPAQLPSELTALGIVEVQRVVGSRNGPSGLVVINTTPTMKTYGIESILKPVAEVLQKSDNRNKLAGSWPRRELFIWANPPSVAASVLSTFSTDSYRDAIRSIPSPQLPAEVTAAWAALWSHGQSTLAAALWRVDESGWEVKDPPGVSHKGMDDRP